MVSFPLFPEKLIKEEEEGEAAVGSASGDPWLRLLLRHLPVPCSATTLPPCLLAEC